MKKRRNPSWREVLSNNKWFVYAVIAVWSLMFACYSISAEDFKPPVYLSEATDSMTMILRALDGTILNDTTGVNSKRFGAASFDSVVTYNVDSSYILDVQIWFAGADSVTTWAWTINPTTVSSLAGGFSLLIGARLNTGLTPVSLLNLTVKDAGGVTKYVLPTNSSGNLTVSVSSGDWTVSTSDFGYVFPESTYTVSANDTVIFLGDESGTVTPPADPAMAAVFGYLKDLADRPIKHQLVFAGRSKGRNATDSTAAFNIISDEIVSVRTDTTGLFNFGDIGGLIRTGQYADTTQGFYNFRAERNGQKIFELLNVYIPDTGTVNLGDTLANR